MPAARPNSQVLQRRVYHFSGRVQGVGFRYTVNNLALQHDVTGYVRNMPDGRVELCVEGPEGEMDRLVDEVRQRMEGFIREVSCQDMPATGEFGRFGIRHCCS